MTGYQHDSAELNELERKFDAIKQNLAQVDHDTGAALQQAMQAMIFQANSLVLDPEADAERIALVARLQSYLNDRISPWVRA